ncbi:MAG: TonB-dependent receptor [Verrucomicrobia bacterium]|nr:TonB-dependent receptor [Verrucomicrobiota bacterium]
MKTLRLLLPCFFASVLLLAAVARAQSARPEPVERATGTIEGRVQHLVTGDRLNNARVSVKGTNLVAFTGEDGTYQLAAVPAGAITLRVFFTGLDEKDIPVTVAPGQVVQQDVKLTSVGRYGTTDETVRLDQFVVQAVKETDAAAIAVNEQRMALGQKSVISADQFGTIPDSNPGELMKWLPGVSVEYFANNIVGVSVRGLDAVNTEIRFDNMPVASASTATLGTSNRDRNFEMMGASAADIARVEVRKLRTPEDSANAIGGSVNMVRRSAFEADRRRFTYQALFTTDHESLGLGSRAGIRDTRLPGWRPNFKLTWTDPVSKTFGYAVTFNHNDVLGRVHWSFPTVNFGNADQAAAAKARLAAGRPLTTVSVLNPAAFTEGIHDNPKQDVTDAASVKLDWRPVRGLRLSYSLSGSRYQERAGDDVRFNWLTGAQSTAVTAAVLDTPLGSPGTNDQRNVYGNLGTGSIRYDLREAWRNGVKDTFTNAAEAEWRHRDWLVNAAGSFSMSKHIFRDTDDGFFGSNTFNGSGLPLTGVGTGTAGSRQLLTVNFRDIGDQFNARTIKSYAAATGQTTLGPELNWQDPSTMTIGGAVSRPGKTNESIGALRLKVKRTFSLAGNPFAVRLGYDYDELFRNVQNYDAKIYTFVGADHIAQTADDHAGQIAAVNTLPERDAYYDFPAVTRVSMRRLYQLYQQHPDWFQLRDAESFRFTTVEPYEVNEKTYAPWLEFSGAFFQNRLTYSGGVRYERADADALGSLDRGSRYVTRQGLVDGTLAGNMVRYVRKGATGHGSNDGWFPSLQLNYSLRENLILRAGFAKTQAKNRFGRAIIPSTTFNFDPVTTGPFANVALGSVNRPKPALKPWVASNYEAHLEYYTAQGGVITLGGFVKDIKNVQVQQTELLDTPAKLAALDLEPTFLNFQATTWLNQGIGQINGEELSVRQPLDRWLPSALRGFNVTGSFNHNHLARFSYTNGNISGDFQNYYENQLKASLGYRRGKIGANLGVIRYGRVYRQREDIAASATNPAIRGDRFYPPYTAVDFNLEFGVTRWAKLFLSGRNITNAQKTRWRVVDGAPAWSNFQIANNLGFTFTAGVTGSF